MLLDHSLTLSSQSTTLCDSSSSECTSRRSSGGEEVHRRGKSNPGCPFRHPGQGSRRDSCRADTVDVEKPPCRALQVAYSQRTPTDTGLCLSPLHEGKLGRELRTSAHDCEAILSTLRLQRKLPDDVTMPRDSQNRPACWSRLAEDPVPRGAIRIRSAGPNRAPHHRQPGFVDRPLVDRTGLSGNFEWLLLFNPNPVPNADAEFPYIYTAFEEQLGLKLQPRMEPYEVFVIESVELPTPD